MPGFRNGFYINLILGVEDHPMYVIQREAFPAKELSLQGRPPMVIMVIYKIPLWTSFNIISLFQNEADQCIRRKGFRRGTNRGLKL